MRRFGLDIKNKVDTADTKQQRLDKSTSPVDAAKTAARLARFGAVDTSDLNTNEKKRTMKF